MPTACVIPMAWPWDDDGTLYATNLGYDDRGVRAVKNSPDWVVKLKKGACTAGLILPASFR